MSREIDNNQARKLKIFFLFRLLLFPALIGILASPDPVRSLLYLILFATFFIFSYFSWSEAWLIALFIIPLQEMAPPLFGLPKLLPHRFILVLAALSLFLRALIKKDLDGKTFWLMAKTPVFLSFSCFILANLTSALYNQSLEAGFRSLTYLEPLFYFSLTWFWIKSEKDQLFKFLTNFLLAGLWVQVIALIEMATQKSIRRLLAIPTDIPWEKLFSENRFGLGGRISSTLSHPVYAGLYFLFLLLLTVYLFSFLQGRRKNFLLFFVPLNLLLILATGTRAVIICLFISLLTIGAFLYRQRKILVPMMAVLLIAFIFLLFLFPQILIYFQKSLHLKPGVQESANLRHRLVLTRTFLEVFKAKPIFGNGPGLIQKEALKSADPHFQRMAGIENQYAIILADGGLLAGLSYLAFIIAVFFQIKGLGLLHSFPEINSGRIFLLAYFLAYLFFIITETCLTLAPNFILMSWLAALSPKWGHKPFSHL